MNPQTRLSEEYAVYSAVIDRIFVGEGVELIVIDDHTTTDLLGEAWHHPSDLPADGKTTGPLLQELENETFRDFVERNKNTTNLEARFNLKLRYVLLSQKDIDSYFHDGGGWAAFYAKFPHSQGIMDFSHVGFSSDMKQAFVYVGNSSH